MISKNRIFDCITFFDENLITNSRFEILNNVVDYFIVCESKYDHKGRKKKINFKLLNKKFENKVRHIVINEKFPNLSNLWKTEEYQREKIFNKLKDAKDDDLILYSDSDEIPDPIKIKNLKLKKKYAIFMQKFFVYKLNIYNKYESPWEGTRICKKKNLKSFTFLRKKILKKNLNKSFWKFYIEKDIKIINNGGWHFNNLYSVETISKKLKVFPHREFNSSEFSNIDIIKKKISNLEDLFDRGHQYKKVEINQSYPEYLIKNLEKYKNYIL
tara:strand:+ start:1000 stop:1812 length:813 start_codon:yes stop_codon:yes gene_type:complete